jgi:hypothetical protein
MASPQGAATRPAAALPARSAASRQRRALAGRKDPVMAFAVSFPSSDSGVKVEYAVDHSALDAGIWPVRVTNFSSPGHSLGTARTPSLRLAQHLHPAAGPLLACGLACRFPDNAEAVLVGFPSATLAAAEKLPEGQGFAVSSARTPNGDGKTWLALTRKSPAAWSSSPPWRAMSSGALDAEPGWPPTKPSCCASSSGASAPGRSSCAREPGTEPRGRGRLDWRAHAAAGHHRRGRAGRHGHRIVGGAARRHPRLRDRNGRRWRSRPRCRPAGFPAKIGSLEQLDDSVRQPLFVVGAGFARPRGAKPAGACRGDAATSCEAMRRRAPALASGCRRGLLRRPCRPLHAAVCGGWNSRRRGSRRLPPPHAGQRSRLGVIEGHRMKSIWTRPGVGVSIGGRMR